MMGGLLQKADKSEGRVFFSDDAGALGIVSGRSAECGVD
jgi:hypothetical protein